MELWYEPACDPWHAALDAYEDVIDAQEVTRLAEHDRWFHEDLPRLIAARRTDPTARPGYVTRDELIRVTHWKMARGVWRARNLQLVQSNQASDVEAASRAALAAIPDPRRPILALTRLAGVGPATASAILAAAAPEHYPFFDDLIAGSIPEFGEVKYTTSYYLDYAARIRDRAGALSAACPHGGWTPHDVDRALWAACGGKTGRPPSL